MVGGGLAGSVVPWKASAALLLVQEGADQAVDLVGGLHVGGVAGAGQELDPGAAGQRLGMGGGRTRSCSPQTTRTGTVKRSSWPVRTAVWRPDGYMAAATAVRASCTPSRRL